MFCRGRKGEARCAGLGRPGGPGVAGGPVGPGVPGGPCGPSGPGGAVGFCFNGFLVGPPRPALKSSTRLYVLMIFQLGDLMDSVDMVRKQFC